MTPKQIENLIETCEGDTDLIDGYDELPPEYQEKIKYALENGHVADEDWKGVSANQDLFRPINCSILNGLHASPKSCTN